MRVAGMTPRSDPPRTYRARLPDKPLTPFDLAERAEFDQLVDDSLPGVRDSAAQWRNGLAAFITLVTTGLVIQGRNTVGDLPAGWRAAITTLVALGLALSITGLWQALAAHAGSRSVPLSLAEIHERYGSIRAFRVVLARNAAGRLDVARVAVAAGLLCLLTGIGLTWWAPAVTAPFGYLRVQEGASAICGASQSSAGGVLRLSVAGASAPVVIPLARVSSLSPVDSCN